MAEEMVTITVKNYNKLIATENREHSVLGVMRQFTKEDHTGDWLAIKLLIIYQGWLK